MKKSIFILAVLSVFAFTSCKEKAADKVNEENGSDKGSEASSNMRILELSFSNSRGISFDYVE